MLKKRKKSDRVTFKNIWMCYLLMVKDAVSQQNLLDIVRPKSEYFERLAKNVNKYGGLFNAHLHLDRASTLDKKYLEHMSMDPVEASSYPLSVKQNITGDLHRGLAYERNDLARRMEDQLDIMIELGTKRADSFIDVSNDNVGLTGLEVALELKEKKKQDIDFRVGAYAVFGFKDSEPRQWEIFVDAANMSDFLGCLPERDDKKYHPRHIGYDEHFRRTLRLANDLGKPIQYHVDQANDSREIGTETLIQAVRWLGGPILDKDDPSVWAIHAISPSAYDEARFQKLLNELSEYNIGVICCPTAAISMRQLRPIESPTHNSIARVLEMLVEGIPVRIGSDNIADIFLPSTTASLYDEALVLSNATRFYNPDILAKILCGKELTDMDRELIYKSLEQDRKVFDDLRTKL